MQPELELQIPLSHPHWLVQVQPQVPRRGVQAAASWRRPAPCASSPWRHSTADMSASAAVQGEVQCPDMQCRRGARRTCGSQQSRADLCGWRASAPEIGGAVKGDGMLLQYAGPHVQGLQVHTGAAFSFLDTAICLLPQKPVPHAFQSPAAIQICLCCFNHDKHAIHACKEISRSLSAASRGWAAPACARGLGTCRLPVRSACTHQCSCRTPRPGALD